MARVLLILGGIAVLDSLIVWLVNRGLYYRSVEDEALRKARRAAKFYFRGDE